MHEIKQYLDEQLGHYNQKAFIHGDPICIPHRYRAKEDIEIAGFLTALLSWGHREMIIKSARQLSGMMNNQHYEFVQNASPRDLKKVSTFYYRTFNGDDLLFLIDALKQVYSNDGGLEGLANKGFEKNGDIKDSILEMRKGLLKCPHLRRSEKHLANPDSGSAAKRINMFLRWMVRKDEQGVDFGLWKIIPPAALMCPLDVHSGRVARKLGLLQRSQNDWKAVEELTAQLRLLDSEDPVKYDYALFGTGVFQK